MDKYSELKAFVSVVDLGSFSAAAKQLSMTKSSISKKVSSLEARLSVKLLNRTTRILNVTESGKLYYDKVSKILIDCDEADSNVSQDNETLEGTLKISAPVTFATHHLKPIIKQYMKENEGVFLNVDLSDRHVNVVEEGFDLALRVGVLPDSSLMANRLAPIKLQLYASPGYIEKNGSPETPEDLVDHSMLNHVSVGNSLCFSDKNGNTHNVNMQTILSINNGDMLVEAVTAGLGISLLPTFLAYKKCKNKSLVSIMSEYFVPELSLYALYPQTQYLPYKVKKLIGMLQDAFGDDPYWDVDCDNM